MSQSISSIFLSLLFLAFLAAPTIISMVDDSVDISIFYSTTEEEEKGGEKVKIFEALFDNNSFNETYFQLTELVHNQKYFFKKYSKPHLNLTSPPPEFYIL